MLGQLSGQDEAAGGLYLARADRVALVVAGEAAGLLRDALKDVVQERVHDRHGLVRDARVRMDLLEDLHVQAKGIKEFYTINTVHTL